MQQHILSAVAVNPFVILSCSSILPIHVVPYVSVPMGESVSIGSTEHNYALNHDLNFIATS